MADTGIVCANEKVKEAIRVAAYRTDVPKQIIDVLLQTLDEIPECENGYPVGFGTPKAAGGGRQAHEKRAPSAYNQFIGTCMKEKHIKGFGEAAGAMKQCAAEYHKAKDAGKL